jgi:hypothetical protein
MNTPLLDVTVKLPANDGQLNVCLLGYQLELATSFGTSHFTSTFRSNALLLLRVPHSNKTLHDSETWELKGVGEVGLPPKKALVYEADLDDMKTFLTSFIDSLIVVLNKQKSCSDDNDRQSDPFAVIPEPYFACIRGATSTSASGTAGLSDTLPVAVTNNHDSTCGNNDPSDILPYALLLEALDTCGCHTSTYARAGRALIESAIFDAWAKDLRVPLYDLINVSPTSTSHRSFYTAALNEDISLIVDAAKFGAKFTPQLKIKLNSDVNMSRSILRALDEALPYQEGHMWSIDANAAWTTEVAMEMLIEVLELYRHRIYMV